MKYAGRYENAGVLVFGEFVEDAEEVDGGEKVAPAASTSGGGHSRGRARIARRCGCQLMCAVHRGRARHAGAQRDATQQHLRIGRVHYAQSAHTQRFLCTYIHPYMNPHIHTHTGTSL